MIKLHALVNDTNVNISRTRMAYRPSLFRLTSELIGCDCAGRNRASRTNGHRLVITVHSPETTVNVLGIVSSGGLLMTVNPILLRIFYSRNALKLTDCTIGCLICGKIGD